MALDVRSVFSHKMFLVTFIISFGGWWAAFIGQVITEAKFQSTPGSAGSYVGASWFGIFLQLALIVQTFWVLATDSVGTHRFQISVFLAVALVFAVLAVNNFIFASLSSQLAIGAGWLLLAIVDIIWLLYMSAEEDSFILHLFNSNASFSRGRSSSRSRSQRVSTGLSLGANGGMNPGQGFSATGSNAGYGGGNGSIKLGPGTTLMSERGVSNVDLTRTPQVDDELGQRRPSLMDEENGQAFVCRAKALYAYTASPDDINEIGFQKGEILDILDSSGKWWQARKADGSKGIVPSNYLSVLNDA